MKRLALPFAILLLLSFTIKAHSQARSNIGVAFQLNKPYSNDYNFGSGVQLQGAVALSSQLAIGLDFGYDKINSKGGYLGGLQGGNPIDNLNMIYFRLPLKYVYRNWFISGAPLFYMANYHGETDGIGVGGTGSVGYNLDLDDHSTLVISLNTDVINITSNGHGPTPIAGLRIAYVINFKGRK